MSAIDPRETATIHYSPSFGGFLHSDIHADLPGDAVEISHDLHQSLLVDQAKGATITTGGDGLPVAAFPPPPSIDVLRAIKASLVKAEAQRRILHIAPIWRQLNDIAAPSKESAARRKQIESLRTRSDEIELTIAAADEPSLEALDIHADDLWR